MSEETLRETNRGAVPLHAVVSKDGDRWSVWGNLDWTDRFKKEYASCLTRESAEAAKRLLNS